jgi:hypothetical protein
VSYLVRYNDFSELADALQIAVNFYHFIEFKRPVDDGLECTTRKTLGRMA